MVFTFFDGPVFTFNGQSEKSFEFVLLFPHLSSAGDGGGAAGHRWRIEEQSSSMVDGGAELVDGG
ncbi:hypothetical protein Dimus_024865 [Dionaea muscipula]